MLADVLNESLDKYRRDIMRKRKELDTMRQRFKTVAQREPDDFKRVAETTFSKYAAIMEDLFSNVESLATLQSA